MSAIKIWTQEADLEDNENFFLLIRWIDNLFQ